LHEIAEERFRQGLRARQGPSPRRAVRPNVPLRLRIALAGGMLALLVSGLFLVLVLAVSNLRATTTQANRSKDVTQATLLLERNVIDLETSLRGYVLSGNKRFLEPWTKARASLAGSIEAIKRLTGDNAAQKRRVSALASSIHAYVEDYAVPILGIARIDSSAARAAVAAAEGERRFDAIRRQFGRILALENALASKRVASAKDQANRAIEVALAALATCAVLVVLYSLELVVGIARPIRRAVDAAAQVAQGDLAVRLPEQGPGEVRHLAVSFNKMARALARGRADLESQNEQLLEMERLRTELISTVSHEARTPLACVLGYTSLLLTRDLDEVQRRRFLEIIAAEGRRLGSLIDDFIDVKRIEEGRLELHAEPIDLGAVLAEQVRILSGRTERHTVELLADDAPLVVRGDSARLAQVVANLLANAVKYSPEGGRIEASARENGAFVRVEVRDEGLGIPAAHRASVFTKFFRGGAAKQHGISGLGLGLAISREIVEAHGGSIGFATTEGEGSCFWFEVPRLDAALERSA
jgi:signal transduction histidine kinase